MWEEISSSTTNAATVNICLWISHFYFVCLSPNSSEQFTSRTKGNEWRTIENQFIAKLSCQNEITLLDLAFERSDPYQPLDLGRFSCKSLIKTTNQMKQLGNQKDVRSIYCPRILDQNGRKFYSQMIVHDLIRPVFQHTSFQTELKPRLASIDWLWVSLLYTVAHVVANTLRWYTDIFNDRI